MTTRVYNFGAGPAMLPETLLKEIQAELLDWQGTGMSVLEIGHRSPEFTDLLERAESNLRLLLNIPANYQILFLGGAARTQFSMIPLNFIQRQEEAAYLVTGVWSQIAYQEVKQLKQAYCLANEEENAYSSIPDDQHWKLKPNTPYVYYTPNETINGVRFPYVPKVNDVPLIADMTSCLLSEPINIKQYGLIFAGAQKNIANAGLTVVIIRDDLLANIETSGIPTMLNYKIHVDNHSLYATPPVFNCYVAAKMFEWVRQQGGIDSLFRQNCLKAAALYQYLDSTEFYSTKVSPDARSIMNVCFSLANSGLESKFLNLAKERGLCALKGHRMVGGIRASLYNAMPMSGVESLIEFMSDFAKGN
jgi:phosphoserine aminotransferase